MKKTFTQEDLRPSEYTIRLIKLIAHSYHPVETKGRNKFCCLN